MPDPLVSIVILNHNHPEVISVCLRTLHTTLGTDSRDACEVVVVDNGSDAPTVEQLRGYYDRGWIDRLVLEPVNLYFSGGNNSGVRQSNPASTYVLLLNSDVAFLRPDWLAKLVAWMEGTITYTPSVWGFHPATPDPGPRDIVSIGWSHDASVLPGNIRPEGWCCLIRRSVWREMSPDLPWHGGFEEMIAATVRDGAKAGVLSQYAPYLVHREGGSGKIPDGLLVNRRAPDYAGWFHGLRIEPLDFALGPNEHDSYLSW